MLVNRDNKLQLFLHQVCNVVIADMQKAVCITNCYVSVKVCWTSSQLTSTKKFW